jgi:spermidine synthase
MGYLWSIVAAEGFVILAIEVSIIRLLMPYVGSGIEVTSILITAVLLPMAFGYDYAGRFAQGKPLEDIREKLKNNFFIATAFMVFALSYLVVDAFYHFSVAVGITNHLLIATAYALVLVVYPIFLLAQTLPLMSCYFKDMPVQAVTGRLLFLSTVGSFMGAVLTSLLLMNWLGMSWTCWFITMVLVGMIFLVSERGEVEQYVALGLSMFFAFLSRDSLMHQLGIVAQTPYSFIEVKMSPDEQDRMLKINHSISSMASKDHQFEYVNYIEEHFLLPKQTAMDVLVLGAGAFSIGSQDRVHHYDFVDIEPKLQEIAETYILQRPLNDNVTFIPKPAVNFLREDGKQYDLIVVDMYSNRHSIPAHLVTREFYELVKTRLKPEATVVLNMIISPRLSDKYSRRMDNTLRASFPFVSNVALNPRSELSNVIYTYSLQGSNEGVYTQDKTTASLDRL